MLDKQDSTLQHLLVIIDLYKSELSNLIKKILITDM